MNPLFIFPEQYNDSLIEKYKDIISENKGRRDIWIFDTKTPMADLIKLNCFIYRDDMAIVHFGDAPTKVNFIRGEKKYEHTEALKKYLGLSYLSILFI